MLLGKAHIALGRGIQPGAPGGHAFDAAAHFRGMHAKAFGRDRSQQSVQPVKVVFGGRMADTGTRSDGPQRQGRAPLCFKDLEPRAHKRRFQITMMIFFLLFYHRSRPIIFPL